MDGRQRMGMHTISSHCEPDSSGELINAICLLPRFSNKIQVK